MITIWRNSTLLKQAQRCSILYSNNYASLMKQPQRFIFGVFRKKTDKAKTEESQTAEKQKEIVIEIKEQKKVTKVTKVAPTKVDQNTNIEVPKIEVTKDNMFGRITIKKYAKQRDKELDSLINPDLLALDNVTFQKFKGTQFKRGFTSKERPFPCSPKVGAYEIKNPIVGVKNYYWCSCGLSKNQPFCDESHIGTKFKPLKFRVEQETESIHLCGCKLSTSPPFCDGKTCGELKSKGHS